MKLFKDWSDAVNPDRVELVFANRNKEYGAYEIRKKYEKLVVRAMLIALSGIALAVAIRTDCPARQPSPKNSPSPINAITASLPDVDTTVSLTFPLRT